MIQPHRTRSMIRKKVKLPGGKVRIHYLRRKPSPAIDPITKKPLSGVPRLISPDIKRLSKSKRRPSRPYGGVLSSPSMRQKIIEKHNVTGVPLEVGQLVVKTAGRDSSKIGVVVEIVDNKTVIIDGQVRRRKCSINHIEAIDKKISIKPKATHETIKKEFKALNIEVKETKPKQVKVKPRKQRKKKEKQEGVIKEQKPKKEKTIKVKKQTNKK